MNELLAKLLEAEILNEETRTQLQTAFQTRLDEAITEAREAAAISVRAELTETWITERDALVNAIDEQVNKFLEAEMTELEADIASFRDLEVEYSKKLVEAKQDMALQLEADLAQLVTKLDTFLEMRLSAEFTELKESIEEARKLDFGRRVFEAFMPEYRKFFVDASDTENQLRESQETNLELAQQCEAQAAELQAIKRSVKMESVLRPLSGKTRDIMETILKSVPFDQLEEAYSNFIGRVMRESVDQGAATEKETPVLAEGSKVDTTTAPAAVVKTGDVVVEGVTRSAEVHEANSIVKAMVSLAGMSH